MIRSTTAGAGLLLALALLFMPHASDASGKGVAAGPNEICPILVGSTVPAMTLTTLEGEPFDLKQAIAAKPTVLIYFRGGW